AMSDGDDPRSATEAADASEAAGASPEAAPRRHRVRRALLWAAAVIGVLLLAAVALVEWSLTTRAGARFVFARASALLPGSLSAGSIEGPIRGPLTVHDLRYRTDRFEVAVQ